MKVLVIDPSGAPIWNAQVAILSSTGKSLGMLQVGAAGEAMLKYETEPYAISVQSPGFRTRNVRFKVLNLSPEPVPIVLEVGGGSSVEVYNPASLLELASPRVDDLFVDSSSKRRHTGAWWRLPGL